MSTLLEEDIETLCKTSPSVTPYPMTIPPNESFPCVTYKRINTKQRNTHSGNIAGRAQFLFSAWGATFRDSLATAKKIKDKFNLNRTDFRLSMIQNEYGTKQAESGNYQTVIEVHIYSDKA